MTDQEFIQQRDALQKSLDAHLPYSYTAEGTPFRELHKNCDICATYWEKYNALIKKLPKQAGAA